MGLSRAQEEDENLQRLRRLKFRGTARIRLDDLRLSAHNGKEMSRGNVDRLKAIFEEEGCRRLEVQHHVPALIDKQALDRAVANAKISPAALQEANGNYPELLLPAQIDCLHGQHRIQAAKEFLPPREKWWAVDLYHAGLFVIAAFHYRPDATTYRYRRYPQAMSDRRVRERRQAQRWRDLPQDPSVSFLEKPQLRIALVGSVKHARTQKSQSPPEASCFH